MKPGFLDKLIGRLDRLDSGSLQTQFLRLAQEKGLLETIFHALQEGLIVVDGEGRIAYTNRAAEKMFGFSAEKAAGHPIARYLREIDWDLVLDLDGDEWTKLVTREIEITYPQRRFIDFYVVPLAAAQPGELGAVVILRDVTRERESETRTIESERLNAITLLAAGVAHEIGNPLNSITIHLQLLERELARAGDAGDRENLAEMVGICRREVDRLDLIIGQFLRALRPSPPSFEPASIRDVLAETLDFLRHEIRDRDVLVEVDAEEELPHSLIDRNQIKQAFFNIIRNAIQAMTNGGLLKIKIDSDDRFVRIAFSDTGPGIDAGNLGALFEPFHTTKPGGTGLGLMIVQRIMRDHGGEIEVRSTPRSGTTFLLYLPRDERRIRLLNAKGDADLRAPGARHTTPDT